MTLYTNKKTKPAHPTPLYELIQSKVNDDELVLYWISAIRYKMNIPSNNSYNPSL